MRPTVHDIADRAGVSLATVDRGLNNRPGVRTKTRERVEKAINEIGYVRDVAAANLAKKRRYRFVFLIPDNDNSFMRLLRQAVRDTGEALLLDRVEAELGETAAFDPEALARDIRRAAGSKPDGIAIVAVDDDRVRAAVAEVTAVTERLLDQLPARRQPPKTVPPLRRPEVQARLAAK